MDYRTMKELIRECGPSELEMLNYISGKDPARSKGRCRWRMFACWRRYRSRSQDVICLGINYLSHAKEAAKFEKEAFEKPEQAIYFAKRVNRLWIRRGGISAHRDLTSQLDYEAELALLLKRMRFRISREQVRDYVFGYTVLNDVSAREVQTGHKQWYFGKSLDGFTPMGPWNPDG